MVERCHYYHGVCGIDERYICYASGTPKCDIREEYEKKLNEEIAKQYKPTETNINYLLNGQNNGSKGHGGQFRGQNKSEPSEHERFQRF